MITNAPLAAMSLRRSKISLFLLAVLAVKASAVPKAAGKQETWQSQRFIIITEIDTSRGERSPRAPKGEIATLCGLCGV